MTPKQREGADREPKVRIGMTLDEVAAVLGPPDRTNPGSEILGGAGKVVGGSPELRSALFFTKYCAWFREEGEYFLTFEHDRLVSVHSAPPGCVGEAHVPSVKPSRFVWIVFAGDGSDPHFVLGRMVEQGQLKIAPNAMIYSRVDRELAVDVDVSSDRIVVQATVFALRSLEVEGKQRDFLDLETMDVRRARPARRGGPAFLLVTIAGPASDPESAQEASFERPRRRDICGGCGISETERLLQWNAPAPPGIVKIGDARGAFMYCPGCQEGICGACSIDLGMSAGCSQCKTELLYMDGEPQ